MRESFVHIAVILMSANDEDAAPGAAVTAALCGHWEHEPPCTVPHHTAAERHGDRVHLRVLFAAAAADEESVREQINDALQGGMLEGPRRRSAWLLVTSSADMLRPDERDHASRLRHAPDTAG